MLEMLSSAGASVSCFWVFLACSLTPSSNLFSCSGWATDATVAERRASLATWTVSAFTEDSLWLKSVSELSNVSSKCWVVVVSCTVSLISRSTICMGTAPNPSGTQLEWLVPMSINGSARSTLSIFTSAWILCSSFARGFSTCCCFATSRCLTTSLCLTLGSVFRCSWVSSLFWFGELSLPTSSRDGSEGIDFFSISAKEGQRPPGTQGVVEAARFGWLTVVAEGSSSRGIE